MFFPYTIGSCQQKRVEVELSKARNIKNLTVVLGMFLEWQPCQFPYGSLKWNLIVIVLNLSNNYNSHSTTYNVPHNYIKWGNKKIGI